MVKLLTSLTRNLTKRSISNIAGTKEAVIVSAVRTPITTFGGDFAGFSAPQLGTIAISSAVERAGISGSDIDEVFMGNVIAAGAGQAPARQAALGAGLPKTVPCTTINKVCASGTKTIAMAAQSIALGNTSIMIAGGMESMSNIPFYVPKARWGYKYGNGTLLDGLYHDGLRDAYGDHAMGVCAEETAKKYSLSREQQDDYAIRSYELAASSTKDGLFKNEIVEVSVSQRGGRPDKVISVDAEFTNIKMEKVRSLRPAFVKDGSVTAANSSTINDGASALVIMSSERSNELGLKPLAKILSFADAATEPIDFPIAPSLAVPPALKRANLSINDIDLWEINEAFAAVALANTHELGLDIDRVNSLGGAVALGHPIGASGARIVTTLVHALATKDKSIGCATICNGGGGATALVVERMN